MKKILLTLSFAMVATLGFSARTIDWSVVSIDAPTELRSTSTGTAFNYDIVLKRKEMWYYMNELKNDKNMKKIVIFI